MKLEMKMKRIDTLRKLIKASNILTESYKEEINELENL